MSFDLGNSIEEVNENSRIVQGHRRAWPTAQYNLPEFFLKISQEKFRLFPDI